MPQRDQIEANKAVENDQRRIFAKLLDDLKAIQYQLLALEIELSLIHI